MRRSLIDGFDRSHQIPNGRPTMTVRQGDLPSAHRWVRRLVPISIVILIVGGLVALVAPAVSNARNDARSAATT
jgi:hypothetical protein